MGKVRIGIAISDQSGLIASPLATIGRTEDLTQTVRDLLVAVADFTIIEAYVGLPLSLSGTFTASTQDALDFAKEISNLAPFPIRLLDERLTTVSASNNLKLAGRSQKSSRNVIDQEAATLILEQALRTESVGLALPGKTIEEAELEG